MKNQIKKAAVLAGLLCSGIGVYAQAPVDGTPPPPPAGSALANIAPPPPPGGRRGPGRGIPQQGLQTVTTLTGRVSAYVANERYVYNAFNLETNGQNMLVRFPEHLAAQLMGVAKKGETATVSGFNSTGPDGVNAFQLVSVKAGGTQINDTPPAPPVQAATPEQKTYTGKMTDFRRNREGMIDGVVVDSKTIIELPPPVTNQLLPMMKVGDRIEVSGFKNIPPAGVVTVPDMPALIHPQTIALNGQTYLVR